MGTNDYIAVSLNWDSPLPCEDEISWFCMPEFTEAIDVIEDVNSGTRVQNG
jgi:hypothetical protein